MTKRTIEISSGPTRLSLRNGQMIIDREGCPHTSVPCEDLGVLIIDHPAVVYTHGLFSELLANKVAMILCGKNHLPQGLLLPFASNLIHTERLRSQIQAGTPLCKRLWQQLVRAKICHQSQNLIANSTTVKRLKQLVSQVKSGDTSNVEAQASRLYWPALFGPEFRRNPDGLPPNNLLNYGYAILRGAVARAICSSGLHPAIGLHHHNRYDAYCLADDLTEPFRPMVDLRVFVLWKKGQDRIDRNSKADLLQFLTDPVILGQTTGPLVVALSRMTASLCRCLEGRQKELDIPVPCSLADTE